MLKKILYAWELLICSISGNHTIPGSVHKLLRARETAYRGNTIVLKDGSSVIDGDTILEIHISNTTLAKGKIGTMDIPSDLQIITILRSELKMLCKANASKLNKNLKAVGGITVQAPGIIRLGFEVVKLPDRLDYSIIRLWMSLLHWTFSKQKAKQKNTKQHPRSIVKFFMSSSSFSKLYGD